MPCKLPRDKSTHHEIEKNQLKYYITKLSQLLLDQVLEIDNFIVDCFAAGRVRLAICHIVLHKLL